MSSHQHNNKNLTKLQETYQKVKLMSDPVGYINSSPELKGALDLVQQSGGDAKSLFYKLAQQKGVDPQSVLDMFK